MVVWGGVGGSYHYVNVGGRYHPMTDGWVPTGNTPTPRSRHAAVWTGAEMIIWGGTAVVSGILYVDTGGKYDPSTDSWAPTTTASAPTGGELPTAVWTGTEMIVWGGYSYDGVDHYWNTGGRYNPGMDSWLATSTTNAPGGRESHRAVWTGSGMIVWGGYLYDGANHELNTGGKYNPGTNNWIATSTTNVPAGRDTHGAVWTGSEMIVWGGYFFDGNDHYLNTGGRYSPDTDSWTATNMTNAPDGRTTHTAVWTGSEMIVWGGQAGLLGYYFNTGGRYDPITDNWTATSIVNAPDGRYRHTAVWTGNEMIVWGGILYSNSYTGTGERYCAQSGPPPTPTPTPTPCTGRCTPTPRPRPTPPPRPSP